MLYLGALFLAKVLDNALSTTKTILIQRSRWVLAGIAVILSDFLYFWITKRIVSADSMLALAVVAAAGGVGCSLACLVSDKLSKDRTYVNVIMSDNLEAMQAFRDFLAEHTHQCGCRHLYAGLEHQNHHHYRLSRNQGRESADHPLHCGKSAEVQASGAAGMREREEQ